MFELIRRHTRVLFFILIVLIIPSFVFFGIEGYSSFRNQADAKVARVGSIEISQAEWDAAQRESVERVRRESPQIDTRLLDTPQVRSQVLEDLIRQRLMLVAADKLHLVTSDDRMLRLFRAEPQFAFLRHPDGSVNKEILAAQGMSSELFAQRLRQDISSRQVLLGVEGSVVAPATAASAALGAFFQQRDVQVQRFEPTSYAAQVKPTDADLEAWHKDAAHAAAFRAPETIDVEYVVLDLATLAKDVKVDEEAVRKYYEQNAARYTSPEERRASHILVKAEAGASDDVKAKAKAKAESLLAEVRKNPASFADVARKNSDDPGSARNGGDLDFFGRGAMVKSFEDAAFALKPGGISDVVASDFGFHVIQVTGARGGEKKSFESVKPEIEAMVRTEEAGKRYSEASSEFSNTVYEQPESLKAVAERFKLELRTAKALQRTPAPGAQGALASPKFLEVVFASEAIRSKRNTDAVEVGPNQLAAARVVAHQPARLRPLEEVRAAVLDAVTRHQAAALARKEGEARLAVLKADPSKPMDARSFALSRVQTFEQPQKIVNAALGAASAKLPVVVGVDLGDEGYAVVKVDRLAGLDPAATTDSSRQQVRQALGEAESVAYYEALKKRFKVERHGAGVAPASAASAASSSGGN